MIELELKKSNIQEEYIWDINHERFCILLDDRLDHFDYTNDIIGILEDKLEKEFFWK